MSPKSALKANSPAANRHAIVDAELRRLVGKIEDDFFSVVELVLEVRDGAYFAKFGFADLPAYLEDRLGLSYRAVMKRLATVEAHRTLPAGEQEAARTALAGIGVTKSSIIAPAIRQDPAGWRDWVTKAAEGTVAAIQERVSRALGSKARGPAEAIDRTYRFLENQWPLEAREEFAAVIALGKRVTGSETTLGVLVAMFQEVKVEWSHR